MYCLLEDGSWARFTSDDNPDAKLNAFRGFNLASLAPSGAPAHAPALAPSSMGPNQYHTLFNNAGVGTVSDGNLPDAYNIHYSPDIPTPAVIPTDIQTITTVDADGTHRYFDLMGRPLNHKPEQGIYIDNGNKILAK